MYLIVDPKTSVFQISFTKESSLERLIDVIEEEAYFFYLKTPFDDHKKIYDYRRKISPLLIKLFKLILFFIRVFVRYKKKVIFCFLLFFVLYSFYCFFEDIWFKNNQITFDIIEKEEVLENLIQKLEYAKPFRFEERESSLLKIKKNESFLKLYSKEVYQWDGTVLKKELPYLSCTDQSHYFYKLNDKKVIFWIGDPNHNIVAHQLECQDDS